MIEITKKLAESRLFERFIILVIIVNGVILGLETLPWVMEDAGDLLETINYIILAIFILEALVKLLACWPTPQRYFASGWNVFDFTVIVLSLIPASGQFATVARLVRLLRVLRLVSTLPKLRLMVVTLVRCIPGMANVLLLMGVLFYVYAIAGYHLYGGHDPLHWGTLGSSLLTLFQIATLEAWTDIMRKAMELGPWHWLYFVTFVLFGTFVVVNLFVAVVINSLEESQREVAEDDVAALKGNTNLPRDEVRAIRELMMQIEQRLGRIERNVDLNATRSSP